MLENILMILIALCAIGCMITITRFFIKIMINMVNEKYE